MSPRPRAPSAGGPSPRRRWTVPCLVPPGTRPGTVQRLRGLGPKRFGKAGRGDIHYRFVLDLPQRLTAAQESAVDELAKAFNGNPRSKLFVS